MKLILVLTALLLPLHSHAQAPQYKSGLNHTRIYVAPDLKEKEEAKLEDKIEDTAEASTQEEDAATRVWEKYKALATGQHQEEDGEKAPKRPEKPEAPKVAETKTPDKSGFSKILETYTRNKESRKDMRTLSFGGAKPTE